MQKLSDIALQLNVASEKRVLNLCKQGDLPHRIKIIICKPEIQTGESVSLIKSNHKLPNTEASTKISTKLLYELQLCRVSKNTPQTQAKNGNAKHNFKTKNQYISILSTNDIM